MGGYLAAVGLSLVGGLFILLTLNNTHQQGRIAYDLKMVKSQCVSQGGVFKSTLTKNIISTKYDVQCKIEGINQIYNKGSGMWILNRRV